jgi:hypothetical protein
MPKIVIAALAFLAFSFLFVTFGYGIAVQKYRLFPYRLIADFEKAINQTVDKGIDQRGWYYREKPDLEPKYWADSSSDDPLNLVTGLADGDQIIIMLVDMAGRVVNEWVVDWFKIWPDADHLSEDDRPKSGPGTHIHGIAMLPDGDVVFNFEQNSLVRLTPCGDVVWKLPYVTHHSVYIDNAGDLWVSGAIKHQKPVDRIPSHVAPFVEPTVLKVSQDGEILQEISLFDLLRRNDLSGYMYMTTSISRGINVTGDGVHLNDVEVFEAPMEEGVFKHGDIMVSFRNISTVMVFDPVSLKVRFIKSGGFIRQHDPDFIDGNTISVFDNNHYKSGVDTDSKSRIVLVDARTGATEVWFEGSPEKPFYTDFMGKSQWLANGNLLVTESLNGRGFELNAEKEIVWDYVNYVEDNWVGMVEEVQRLDSSFTPMFRESQAVRCAAAPL